MSIFVGIVFVSVVLLVVKIATGWINVEGHLE